MTITLTRATWQQHLHAGRQQSQPQQKKTTAKNTTSNLSRFTNGQANSPPKQHPPHLSNTPVSASNTALPPLIPLTRQTHAATNNPPEDPRTSIYTVPRVGALNAPFTSTMMPCPIFANS